MSLEGLEHLELNLSLSDILLTAAAAGDLLGLGDLVLDGVGAEVLKRETLNSVDAQLGVGLDNGESTGEEELLGSTTLLNDLNKTGLELLNRGNVVGENTHLSGLGGDVDLDNAGGLEDSLVRKGQGKLDLVVHGLSVTSALERSAEGRGTGPEGRASEAERAHLAMDGEETTVMVSLLDLCLSCKGRSRMPVVP